MQLNIDTQEASQPENIGASEIPELRLALNGLTSDQVLEQRQQYGENILPAEKGPSAWSILFSQLKSPLVYIILAAAFVSLIVGEFGDFAIIMVVVVIDAVLGFIQEYQAQRTYSALKGLLKPTTTVIRDGERKEIEVRELVPGDMAVLNAGEHVPGDGQIVEGTKLSADEAILTGESEPVNKSTASGQNQLFMGTTVVTGRGLMQVSHTGCQTELGKIATSLQEHVEVETPLQVRMKAFSKTLTRIVVGFTLAILISGLVMGRPFLEMLRTSIILAIAAVPEGLLIAVTVILVLGMRKILKRSGLVKKMLAVETLGSVTVICTDKTGTLTEGRMRVTRTDLWDKGRAMQVMALCNDLEGPVDIALWEYTYEELDQRKVEELTEKSERLEEELFTSETKFMITSNRLDGSRYDFLKGAPEIVLGMCSTAPEERRFAKERLLEQVDAWASEGLRLLGLAYRLHGALDLHSGYTWVGLVGMQDPIRDGVPEAIQVARRGGIQVKMITGDYSRTAERIGRNIDLFKEGDEILEGEDIERLSDEELRQHVGLAAIFARIRPNDKLRIVRALQENEEITSMIGDGVNDAPALKRSNIGVVVGTATDVAKENADLILLDNSFRTVVAAVEEGRVIFENIRKVVAYTLSNSFAEVLLIFVSMILGWPAPLLVAQILWIHLICDGPSDIVLGFEPKENGIMDEKPRSIKEPVLTPLGLSLIGVISISSAVIGLLLFHHFSTVHGSIVEGRSFVFASFAVNSMIYIFAYRSLRQPIVRMAPLSQNKPLVWAVVAGLLLAILPFVIPALGEVLGVVPLDLEQWALVFTVAGGLLMIVELAKWVNHRLVPRVFGYNSIQ
jgi:Ca2+-transporting ATPase